MDNIELVDYNPKWPSMFTKEAKRLRATLDADLVLEIEHFGSTAIPGLSAKPIIDILVLVRSIEEAKFNAVRQLEQLGYIFWADNPATDRMLFIKGMPPHGLQRTHHVHLVDSTSDQWVKRLGFRDFLRAHPEEATRYEALKKELAIHFKTDREAYTAGKTSYVEGVLEKAKSEPSHKT